MAHEIKECRLATALGDGVLQLKRLRVSERLSSLFEMSMDLVSADDAILATDIVGTQVAVGVPMPDGQERYFHAVVSRFTMLGSYGDEDTALISYHATCVPWFWTLTRNHDCRVFMDMSVKEIAEAIFSKYGFGDHEFFKLNTKADAEPMDYCVQYRESDFDFLSRLFEQWGLGYTFEHHADKHVLRVFDDSPGLPENPFHPTAIFASAEGAAKEGDVETWVDQQEFVPGKFALRDYNFEDPSNDLEVPTSSKISMPGNEMYELYDYPGEYVTKEDGQTGKRGDAFVNFRMEAEEAASRRIEGSGGCTGFGPGTHFQLVDHFSPLYDKKKFLLTEVEHTVVQSVGSEAEPAKYDNSFACIPSDVPFRPRLTTEKPVVVGTHTGLVVGPENEEIFCDEYGRVKVQFHWDRYNRKDGTGVAWVRVQQSVGGKRWGMQFVPRIGQEVVCGFEEGDPDRPLITGVVYNKNNMPPYEVPANKTQTGWKTRSTKDGSPDNFNEIRFEDKKGSEELFLQAEKNMTLKVKASESETVGGGISTSAGGTISRKAGGDISRATDSNIKDTATSDITTESGGSMSLTSGGSYMLKTNLGIQLQAINFAYQAVETGAKAAAEALKNAAGAASGPPTAASQAAETKAANEAKSAMTATVLTGATALSSFVDSQASSESAAAVEGAAGDAAAASQSFADAVAAGDGAAIAESAVALAAAAGEAYSAAKEMVEAIISAIPSISLWAMKDISGYALWNISFTSKLRDIAIAAEQRNVSVSAKKELSLVAEDKDLAIEAGKQQVVVKAKKAIVLECGKSKFVLKDDGTIKVNGKTIDMKGTDKVKIKGPKVNEN